ncbi:cyclic nucleotide-binding domain-containing protein [Thiohalobacter sp. IOR34]|uniref:Crp/Fnr family transcriptional regulator n=1 Tax=Thiohalobacter sp. IOR34 TaxID=3057176 RepID=UPI0025B1293E|nr:cyclic nucleotide-binding domain-containing protein [Thiohalobacter sp. IOR34]WJW74479.1 cyclic nucleotide-binding domain-containing protein [Thiohalobacter sp. IOR34]
MVKSLLDLLEEPAFAEGEFWQRRRYGPNQVLFREGEPGSELFVLLAGAVRVTGDLDLEAGRHIHPGVCDLQAGAVFGEVVLFDAGPRSATVTTLEASEVAVIDGDRLLAFFERHPEIGYPVLRQLMAVMVQRLRQTNKKVLALLAWGLKVHDIDQHL